MAKKKQHKLELTPIMALSIMLLFLIMVPLFFLSNTNPQASKSKAYSQQQEQMEASDEMMEDDSELEPASLRVYN